MTAFEPENALVISDEAAASEIRRLARKYRLNPKSDHGPELLAALDDLPMVRARYLSKRGTGLDDFAHLLSETVTAGRPTLARVVELLQWALQGSNRADKLAARARTVEQLETRGIAAGLVAAQEQAVIAFHNRTRRGTKLTPWICECPKPAAWASFGVDLSRFQCRECATTIRRKTAIPTLDEASIVAAADEAEPPPF